MAAAVICECCGKIKPIKDTVHVRVHTLATPTEFKNKADDYFDVCNDCYKKIEAMLAHKEKNK